MENTSRTAYGTLLQLAKLFNLDYTPIPGTTLNEKFSIAASEELAEDDNPYVRYIVIGNGGHQTVIDANTNVSAPTAVRRRVRAAALYNHIPFAMRPTTAPFTEAERTDLRLRRIEEHNGQTYEVYYAKVITGTIDPPELDLRDKVNGVTTVTPFVPDTDDLNPTPPLNNDSVELSINTRLTATVKVPFELDSEAVNEIINACEIIYGDPAYAFISEAGLAYGVDRSVLGNFNGTPENYTEAVVTTLLTSLAVGKILSIGTPTGKIVFSVGSDDPLYTSI